MFFTPASLRFVRYAISCAVTAATAVAVITLSGCGTAVPAASQRVEVDARANGIAIRPSDNTIFITDDKTNGVLSSANGKDFVPYATIPPVTGQPNSLSQLIVTDDGSLLVAQFGFGKTGAVLDINKDRSALALQGPDPARRRLGMVAIGRGKLLSSWFVKGASGPPSGGVSLIIYDESTHEASEHNLLTGLGKPVGIEVQGDDVFISDQANNMILEVSLSALVDHHRPGGVVPKVIKIDQPDLLAIDSGGALYTKCNSTAVCEITPDGKVVPLANDFHDARGVAVDSTRGVLFVVDRADNASGVSTLRALSLKQ